MDGTEAAASADLGFRYRTTKAGDVMIDHHGRMVTQLRGKGAAEFLAKVARLDAEGQQQLMARATGNYKRGNERGAAGHARNR